MDTELIEPWATETAEGESHYPDRSAHPFPDEQFTALSAAYRDGEATAAVA